MLVKVLYCFMETVSNSLKRDASVKNVRNIVEDSIARSFAEALGVETVQGPSAEALTDLITKEVVTQAGSKRPVQPKPTNSMIRLVCRMLKKFAGKMCCCSKKQRRHSSVQTSSYHTQAKRNIDREPSITQSVQSVLSVKMNLIIEPIVEDVEKVEYNQLQKQFSRETQTAAEDIAQSFTEYISSKDTESVQSSPKSQQQEGVRAKICNFFARMFAKASICRIFSQVKTKYHSEANVSDDDAVNSLMVDVEPVLQTGGDPLGLIHRLQNMTRDDMLKMTSELSDLLYSHFTGDPVPETLKDVPPGAAGPEIEPSASIYADIRHRVICFLSLMSWWLENQVSRYSDKVLALMENERSAQAEEDAQREATAAAEALQDEAERREVSRTCLRFVVTSLIRKVRKAVKGDRSFFTDLESTIQRMVDETWAQLKGTEVNIIPITVENLDRVVFRDLRKKWDCSWRVLVSMERGDPELLQCVAASCKSHLMKPRSSTCC
ncbi:hypothetical protein JOB18_019969 [Solea senegalensis]|uniref:Uncharacterized protein n=1 Tax=Solea senegalensis TaxID=28829 RepID=A0AAV6T703_SOLSE|nr:hypothetical protein JOB18_019969 [Solea senegalensis]